MRVVVMLALVTVGHVSADDAGDLKKLEGDWELTALRIMGQDRMEVARMKESGTRLRISGTKMVGFQGEMSFKIDSSKKPKWMDLKLQSGERTVEAPAIFDVTDDELIIVFSPAPQKPTDTTKRPESLDSKEKAFIYLRAKRAK